MEQPLSPEMIPKNRIIHGDNVEVLGRFPKHSVDLVVTSPPYDDLRTYGGLNWDFPAVLERLLHVVKPGGVVVWVVSDATVKGSETLSSFRQAIAFQDAGFRVHDTMIWHKPNPKPFNHNRYEPAFEYMFVFSRGKPNTWNPLKEPTKGKGPWKSGVFYERDGSTRKANSPENFNDEKIRQNIWSYGVGGTKLGHPAVFPLQLATDHVLSWSNPGDLVLDPFCGSGTTCVAAEETGRDWVGIDSSAKYVEIAENRIAKLYL